MANIKLVGNSWEAEGIFDKTQNKTQKAINSEVVSKLSGIEAGAQVNRTYTATTGKPTANQTPSFGDTVTVSQVTQDATGQISVTDRTIEIPNSTASTSAAGLMSAADKTALDTAVTNIGTMSEMGTTATTLAGGIGELKENINNKAIHLQRPIRFLQISDTHFSSGFEIVYNITAEERMNRVVDWIIEENNKTPLDFVIHTGDFTSENLFNKNNDPDFLKIFYNSFVSQIPCPFYAVPGNHEGHNNEEFKDVTGVPRQYTVEFGDIVLIVLDTFNLPTTTGSGGSYKPVDVEYLRSVLALDEKNEKKYILFSHYFQESSETTEFKNIVENDDRILYLVQGHTHMYEIQDFAGKKLITGGNVSVWLINGIGTRTYDAENTWGYVIHELTEDGMTVQHIQPAGVYFYDNNSTERIEFPGLQSEKTVISTGISYKKSYDFSLEKDIANKNLYRGNRLFEKTQSLKYARELISGTDLNNITEVGVYKCISSSSAQTLLNIPNNLNSGFLLKVEMTQDATKTNKAANYSIRQTIIPSNMMFYVAFRRGTQVSGVLTWTDWQYIEKNKIDFSAPTYISGNTFDLNSYNNASACGFYYIGTNVVNAPANYIFMFVLGNDSTFLQICFGSNSLFYRLYGGNPRTWGKWKSLTGVSIA